MTPSTPQAALPQLPQGVPPPPMFGMQAGQKKQPKSPTMSFLGAAATPSKANVGTEQLVGR